LQLKLDLVSCLKKWEEVDKKTGEIIFKYSPHQWISSIRVNIDNVHELCNLGARKIGLLEDSINTENIVAIITNMLFHVTGMPCKDSTC